MSVIGNNILAGASGQGGYEINQSLRFNSADSAWLSKTFASDGSLTTWTWSAWVKRSGSFGSIQHLFGWQNFTGGNFQHVLGFDGNNNLAFLQYNSALGVYLHLQVSNAVYRDPSAWYHVVAVFDTNNAAPADRVRLYVNGDRITSLLSDTHPSSGREGYINDASYQQGIGRGGDAGSYYFNGYLAEINFIDGSALTPSSFGKTDLITGAWIPKKYSGTYGTNGFYLPWSNATIGTDLTSTATLTAPFGGNAENARTNDASYLTSNTSTGSGFTLLQEDFGSVQQLSRYEIYGLYFTGGTSTWLLEYSSNGSSWAAAATLSVTASGQNFSNYINVNARYVRLRATAFGTNGTGNINALIILQDPLGADASGNNNNWNVNAFSVTAGVGNDVLSDTPTTNYCTWNPLDTDASRTTAISLANGNLDATISTFSSVQYVFRCATFASNGKDYFEVTKGDSVNKRMYLGFLEETGVRSGAGSGGVPVNFYGYASGDTAGANTAYTVVNGTYPVTGLPALDPGTAGDVIMVAHDRAAKKIWFGKNGTWFTIGGIVGDPATGTAPAITYTTDLNLIPAIGPGSFASSSLRPTNFGQRAFAYTPPTGYKALNTANLPEPTIKDGGKYFNTVLWTGTGATNSRSDVGFQPDFVWIKEKNNIVNHLLYDAVRGVNQALTSNSTQAEVNYANSLTAFNSNGFTVGTASGVNDLSDTYVAWCWKESATPGFDIVTYTGDGTTSSSRLIDHNLGVTPDFIITKKRSSGTTDFGWSTWHKDLGGNYGVWLHLANGRNSSMWAGYTNFSSTKFTPPDLTYGNENGQTYVNYLWTEVEGFSKFGSYTGNGLADGPFVHTGFKIRFLLLKKSTTGVANGNWYLLDATRNEYNPVDKYILPNSSAAEGTTTAHIDFLSNGFKVRTTNTDYNESGQTYIFAAFAEHPFKYANAR